MRDIIAEIKSKCEQYWNERNICDEEIHAILEFIHVRCSALDQERDNSKKEAEHEEVFEALCEEIAELHTEIDDLNKDRASRCACRFDLDSIPAAKVEASRFMHGDCYSICAYHQHREAWHAKEIASLGNEEYFDLEHKCEEAVRRISKQLEEVKEWEEWYANGGKT